MLVASRVNSWFFCFLEFVMFCAIFPLGLHLLSCSGVMQLLGPQMNFLDVPCLASRNRRQEPKKRER